MERVEVTTVVYADVDVVFDFLLDFPGYAAYSKYLTAVRQDGDGGPGTAYELEFRWWKLGYTAHSTVTAIDRPERIDWRITKDIDATGHWHVTPVDVDDAADGGADPPEDASTATAVTLEIEYEPETARLGNLDLPRFVSVSWVIEKVKPKIETEATRIVERVVADLEGDRRDVDLEVRTERS